MWPDQDFQTESPIGRPLPYNITCAPVHYATGQNPTTCILELNPIYAVNVTSQNHVAETLRFARLPYQKTEKNPDLLDAMAILLQSFPDLNEPGYAGYGYCYRNLRKIFVNNATSRYKHGIWAIGKPKQEAEATFAPVRKALSKVENELFINETYITYNDYWLFYDKESG